VEKARIRMQMENDAMSMLACLHSASISTEELAVLRGHIRLGVQAILDEYLKDSAERPEDSRMAYIAAITAIATSGAKRLREFHHYH